MSEPAENPSAAPQPPAGTPTDPAAAPQPAAAAASSDPAVAPVAGARKPGTRMARRPGPGAASGTRRPGGASAVTQAPAKPDILKTIAFVVCGILVAAIVVVGVYKVFFKPAPQPKTTKLSDEAQKLADDAAEAKKLYEEGHAKASGTTLEDLTEASEKLRRACDLFNAIADKWKTVPGHEDDIGFARARKDSIDKELLAVNTKKNDLEMQALRTKPKTTESTTPNTTPATPAPAAPATTFGKEPTAEELTDKNLDRLFNDDPSEYERLAKIREKKDPTFKMKHP